MRLISLLSSAAFVALAAAAPLYAEEPAKPAAKEEAKDDYIMLRVNGEAVPRSRVLAIWHDLFPDGKAPAFDSFDEKVRMNVLRGIVSEQLVYEEAKKSGVENSPEVAEKLAKLKEKLVTQAFLEQKADARVSDAEIRKIYDQKVAELKGKEEIKARHILVDSEDKAEDIAEKIRKGAKFEDIAKKESLDKGTGVKGGDLGWFTEEQMVPEFSKAAFKLKKDAISDPVKSSFGWHIIQVQDRRKVEVPPYEQVKGNFAQELKAKALKDYVGELLQGAKVQYFAPDGSEKPFSKELPKDSKAKE
jgi:peptidyl-prolyl cis-trans isomerase C